MSEPSGMVFGIHRASLDDGPGIRTTVFLKGCALRCRWCHNPESWSPEPQTAGTGDEARHYGRVMTASEVLEVVRRDKPYYERSGGGLTLSGGEPTLQLDFCRTLLSAARAEHLHTCLDTCGCNEPGVFVELLPFVNLFLWDYKATGSERHRELTGVPSEQILANLEALYSRGARIRLRCPMVPGVNDTPDHFHALGELARRYPRLEGVEVLPYHDTGRYKYGLLGLPVPELMTHVPTDDDKARWRQTLEEVGVSPRGSGSGN
jgi:glycyl-radical enzyme activating protein